VLGHLIESPRNRPTVIPAKAGIQRLQRFARHSRERGNPATFVRIARIFISGEGGPCRRAALHRIAARRRATSNRKHVTTPHRIESNRIESNRIESSRSRSRSRSRSQSQSQSQSQSSASHHSTESRLPAATAQRHHASQITIATPQKNKGPHSRAFVSKH